MARPGGISETTNLTSGLERGAFEDMSISPSNPLSGNYFAGASKAMASKAVLVAPVGEVPSLGRRKAVLPRGYVQWQRRQLQQDSFSTFPHSDVPSLTVVHAPVELYQPIVVASGSYPHKHRLGPWRRTRR